MNVLFLLTPKNDVEYVFDYYTLRQTLEKMEYHRYSSIPMINKDGKYIGVISEGDILWFIKDKNNLNLFESEKISTLEVPRYRDYESVHVETNIEDLFSKILIQNFVPIVDDREIFIGIVTRKDVLNYFYKHLDAKKISQ